MNRKAAIATVVTALALATGCSGEDAAPGTSGPPQPTTVEELDAAIRPAAVALLDAPGFETTVLRFGEERKLDKTTWLDYRSAGQHVSFLATIGGTFDRIGHSAWIQVGGERYCATSGISSCGVGEGGTDGLWTRRGPAPTGPEVDRIPIGLDLAAMAEGSTLNSAAEVPDVAMELTKQVMADGGTVWTWTAPFLDGDATRSWTVDRDGVLVAHSLRSETVPIDLVAATALEFEFTIVENPAPIVPPDVGSALDLAKLGLPGDLPRPE